MSVGRVQVPRLEDDHGVHISEQEAFEATATYEALPQAVKDLFALHKAAHYRLELEQARDQMEANAVRPGIAALPQPGSPIGALMPPTLEAQRAAVA